MESSILLPWPNLGEGKRLWALVPNLEFVSETPKALLMQQGLVKDPVWIPKSQVSFDLWIASRFFVGMTLWIAKKKDLSYFSVFEGEDCPLAFLQDQERRFAGTLTSQNQPTKLSLQELLIAVASPSRIPLIQPSSQGKVGLSLPSKLQEFLPGFFPPKPTKGTRQTPSRKPRQRKAKTMMDNSPTTITTSLPKRLRAMNIHEDEEER